MTLAAGTKLGPYEIIAPIGAGGMGEAFAEENRKRLIQEIETLCESCACCALCHILL
jgi:hypothetical protein